MTFLEKVRAEIINRQMVSAGETVAVALSGGIDSMSLVFALKKLGGELGIKVCAVNVEHGIRGETSKRDSAFVRSYCDGEGIPLFSFERDVLTLAGDGGMSVEECAREVRYQIFAELIKSRACDKVALAHHADDAAETVFMRVLRGTGLRGLSGLRSVRDGVYIRPFLCVTKAGIAGFAEENRLPFVEDETNADSGYSRNFIRNEVFPLIETRYRGFASALIRLSENAAELDGYLAGQAEKYIERQANNTVRLREEALGLPYISKIALDACFAFFGAAQDIERRHAVELRKLSNAANGATLDMPFGIRAAKEYGFITFFKPASGGADDGAPTFSSACGGAVSFDKALEDGGVKNLDGKYILRIERVSGFEKPPKASIAARTLCLDRGKLPKTAVIRTMRCGDVFCKLGGGTKKLCDYFTDIKIEKRLRPTVPLVADASSNEVFAVVGVEIADCVAVGKDTRGGDIIRLSRDI